MKRWAFAVSPDGLGLSSETFWALNLPQYQELKLLWAAKQALFHNAHFPQSVPWDTQDFLRPGTRDARIRQTLRDKAEVMAINRRLNAMKPGAPPPDNLPDWAFGAKGRPVNGSSN